MEGRGGKENTEAQTQAERCDTARLKHQSSAERKYETDEAKRRTDRQTDRGRKRWVVVSHGERAEQQ